MINDETKRKLREMKLGGMIDILEIQQKDPNSVSQTFDERFQRITDYMYQEKYSSTVQRLIKQSCFRLPKAEIHDVHYEGRGIDRAALMELSTCQFARFSTNVILQGFTGSGKTFLACALGKQACKQLIRTRYVRLPDLLIEHDEAAAITRSSAKLLKKYSSYGLLIIDEWLLDELSEEEQHFVLELVERRHDAGSTVFCTQYRREDWHKRLGGLIHADAIMDRIVHNAVWVETGSMNMREHYAKDLLKHV
jgi:DNA replication protein DnaC